MTFAVRLALLLVAMTASVAAADEPRAAFALKDGWVELALQQDGKPVADASVQIIDDKGQPFGDGETGPSGQASFPAPRGASFTLEIKAAGRTSDPIRLYMMDQRLEPARVLLSYGLRPCCRFKSQSDTPTEPAPETTPTEPAPSLTKRVLLVAILGGVPLLAAIFFVQKRRRAGAALPSPKE